jgi:predicted PurR-regulated permease PerM
MKNKLIVMYVLINNFNDSIVRSVVRLNSRAIVSKSTCCLVFIAISACLLSYSPLVHAQNSSNVTKINNVFNQAKNASMDLVNQTPGVLKGAYNQAKNASMDLVNQTPGVLKGAYNQAKNASMDLVNQTVTLIKNDTNSSKLLNQLKSDFGSLFNEFSNFLSR